MMSVLEVNIFWIWDLKIFDDDLLKIPPFLKLNKKLLFKLSNIMAIEFLTFQLGMLFELEISLPVEKNKIFNFFLTSIF